VQYQGVDVTRSLRKLILVLVFAFASLSSVQAQMNPRIKALGAMALYGTAGGALLGTASLAFGSGGRSIAKGASLGLYAGIIFGSYIVISHAYSKHRRENPTPQENYYPDTQSPYEDGQDPESQGFYWNPSLEQNLQYQRENSREIRPSLINQKGKLDLNFSLPLVQFSF
jgi:hypothetical protein